MQMKQVITALAALAQESRLAVFRLLNSSAWPRPSLSFHLKELTHAGLIVPPPDGRFIIYAANFETMNTLIGFLTQNCCGGNVCSPHMLTDDRASLTAELDRIGTLMP